MIAQTLRFIDMVRCPIFFATEIILTLTGIFVKLNVRFNGRVVFLKVGLGEPAENPDDFLRGNEMIEYTVVGDDPDFESPIVLRGPFEKDDPSEIAERCARDFHNDHDGWEYEWPLKIAIRVDGDVKVFSVDRDYSPYFSAHEER